MFALSLMSAVDSVRSEGRPFSDGLSTFFIFSIRMSTSSNKELGICWSVETKLAHAELVVGCLEDHAGCTQGTIDDGCDV